MITKEQIEKAAHKYCRENNCGTPSFAAFMIGAELMLAENERLRAAIAAALAVSASEEWDELNQIKEILKQA